MKIKNFEQVRMALEQNIQIRHTNEGTDTPDYFVRCIRKAVNLNATPLVFGHTYVVIAVTENIDNYWTKVVNLIINDYNKYLHNGEDIDDATLELSF